MKISFFLSETPLYKKSALVNFELKLFYSSDITFNKTRFVHGWKI